MTPEENTWNNFTGQRTNIVVMKVVDVVEDPEDSEQQEPEQNVPEEVVTILRKALDKAESGELETFVLSWSAGEDAGDCWWNVRENYSEAIGDAERLKARIVRDAAG